MVSQHHGKRAHARLREGSPTCWSRFINECRVIDNHICYPSKDMFNVFQVPSPITRGGRV